MLTPATAAIFAREIIASSRKPNAAIMLPLARERHAKYEADFDALLRALQDAPDSKRRSALANMLRLDTRHCRSGTCQYAETVRALAAAGFPHANCVFSSDRRALAAMFAPAQAVAA